MIFKSLKKFSKKPVLSLVLLFLLFVSLVLGLFFSQQQQDLSSQAAGTNLTVTLYLHGIGKGGDNVNPVGDGNGNLKRMQRSVKIEVYDEQNKIVLTKEGGVNFTPQAGNFTGTIALDNVPSGSYILRVKTTQHLRVKVPGIYTLEGTTTQLPPVYLVSGDINNDNTLNILDYNILIGCYEEVGPAVNCIPNNKVLSDLTDDGTVNGFDYNLFLREISTRRGEEDGPVISPTTTKTPTPSATRTLTPTKTPTPTATRTPTPVPPVTSDCNSVKVWTKLEACGWPGSTNTGYPAGTTLKSTSGRTISADNTVINGEKITGRIFINAKNVTIKNSWIISTGGGTNGTGVIELIPGSSVTVDHVTIDGGNNAHSCIWHKGASMTVTAVNCFNVNDGIFSWQDKGGTTQGNNFTIQDSYIHNLTEATGNGHIDGYQTEGARNGVIKHNTIDIHKGQNAAVSIWNSQASSDNILVENNLLAGGGFTVYAEDYHPSESNPAGGLTVTNITFKNNKFSTVHFGCVGSYGVWFHVGPSDGWKRSGNVILETNKNIDNGNPTYNGSVCN